MSPNAGQPSLFDSGGGAGESGLVLPRLWLQDQGPEHDVVVSSRIRLARNVEGFHFKPRFHEGEPERLEAHLRQVLHDLEPRLRYHSMETLSPTERQVMFERHLVSREHVTDRQPRGVAVDEHGRTSILVNEEDHLRLQMFSPGLDLDALVERAWQMDERIAERVRYAFDNRFGFKTSCPTNTGTGMRISVMLHLPAMAFRNDGKGRAPERDIVKMQNAAQQVGLTIRGLFGESSRAEGDFFQVSNQVTLGRPPEQTLSNVRGLVEVVLGWERGSRRTHMQEQRARLEDHVWRARGTLTHARRMTSSEALTHLSALRLGVFLGLLPALDVGLLSELMVTMRPGHLQHAARRELAPDERDEMRATLIRDTLSRN